MEALKQSERKSLVNQDQMRALQAHTNYHNRVFSHVCLNLISIFDLLAHSVSVASDRFLRFLAHHKPTTVKEVTATSCGIDLFLIV